MCGPSGQEISYGAVVSACAKVRWGSREYGEFPKIRGTFLGIPIIRIVVFWGLDWGLPILGNFHICCVRSLRPGRKTKVIWGFAKLSINIYIYIHIQYTNVFWGGGRG